MAKQFGGFGGIPDGRKMDYDNEFEVMIDRLFGDRIRNKPEFCVQLWSALANITWTHTNGDEAGYTFRAAGDMIAAIRAEGDYLDWYCSGPYATVTPEIEQAMATEGWTWKED